MEIKPVHRDHEFSIGPQKIIAQKDGNDGAVERMRRKTAMAGEVAKSVTDASSEILIFIDMGTKNRYDEDTHISEWVAARRREMMSEKERREVT